MGTAIDLHTFSKAIGLDASPPSIGEVVYCGAHRGHYLGKYSACQYIVQWDDETSPQISPSGLIQGTGQVDSAFVMQHVLGKDRGICEKGAGHVVVQRDDEGGDEDKHSTLGPKVGNRIQKRRQVDLIAKRKERTVKKTKKGLEPGSASDEFHKSKFEFELEFGNG